MIIIDISGNRRMSGVDIAKLCERIQDSNLIDKPVDHIAQTITPRPNNEEKISHKDKGLLIWFLNKGSNSVISSSFPAKEEESKL